MVGAAAGLMLMPKGFQAACDGGLRWLLLADSTRQVDAGVVEVTWHHSAIWVLLVLHKQACAALSYQTARVWQLFQAMLVAT